MIDHTEKMKALSDETRFRIMRVLIKAETRVCVCELEAIVEKPQYAISRALAVLRAARLVSEERDGKLVKYGVVAENEFARKLLDAVAAVKCADGICFAGDVERLKSVLAGRDADGRPVAWCGCK